MTKGNPTRRLRSAPSIRAAVRLISFITPWRSTATYAIGLGRTGCYYPDQKTLRQWWVNAGIRHNGGMTLVLYDTHAKWVKEEFLLQHPEWFIAGNHNIPADELARFNATGR